MFRRVFPSHLIAGMTFAAIAAPALAVPSLTMTTGLSVNRNTPFNLITNGSFEDGANAPDAVTPIKYWATGTTLTPFAVPPGWASVGDTQAYAAWAYDTVGPYVYGSSTLPHGNRGLYFGNQFASAISQPPTFNGTTGVVTFPSPPTITPKGPGYIPPVQLTQTVSGLNTGAIYKFTFWTSGEAAQFGGMSHDGIFGLDVTGFSTIYLQAPAGAGADTVGASHVYEFYLQPASSSTTFKWTNWGHYGIGYTAGYTVSPQTDELVLDDVILNFDRLVPEPATLGLVCLGSALLVRRRRTMPGLKVCLLCLAGMVAASGSARATMTQNTGPQIATPSGNLVTNGSFETGAPPPGFANQLYWATGTVNTPFSVPPGWTSSGQSQTYALWGSGPGTGIEFSDTIPDGQAGVYFGNASTSVTPSPAFGPNHNVSFGSPPVFNPFYGGPCTLSQTVNTPATPAPSYVLNFWVSGEDASQSAFAQQGVFGLKVTNVLPGDPIQYFAVPNNSTLPSYRLEFFFTPINPLAPVNIQFINWGHITAVPGSVSLSDSTEVVLDDVIVNALPEPTSLMLVFGGTALLSPRRGRREWQSTHSNVKRGKSGCISWRQQMKLLGIGMAVAAISILHPASAQASMTLLSGPSTATHVGNLVTNGSFENGGPGPGAVLFWATGTTLTPFGVPSGWSSSGAPGTYAMWGADAGSPVRLRQSDVLPDGVNGMYFGNGAPATTTVPPTFHPNGTVTFSATPGLLAPTGAPAVLTQTVPTNSNLAPAYLFSFWASGEFAGNGQGSPNGIFGLRVTNVLAGDPMQYFAVPGGQGINPASRRFDYNLVPLNPLLPITFEFYNWGHFDLSPFGGPAFTSELVIDDVIVNTLPEPASLLLLGAGCVVLRKQRRSSFGSI